MNDEEKRIEPVRALMNDPIFYDTIIARAAQIILAVSGSRERFVKYYLPDDTTDIFLLRAILETYVEPKGISIKFNGSSGHGPEHTASYTEILIDRAYSKGRV